MHQFDCPKCGKSIGRGLSECPNCHCYIELTECSVCGRAVARNALSCQNCGQRSRLTQWRDLLSGLTTIGSIILGFELAALVELYNTFFDDNNSWLLHGVVYLWILSAISLTSVLLLAEWGRVQQVGAGEMEITGKELKRFESYCQVVGALLGVALLLLLMGLVLLGFSFSIRHGIVALFAALGLFVFALSRVLRLMK